MRKHQERRSDCPINYALETFGDMWSLLIIRDMVYFGKKTYREFLESDEGIATNILASRLVTLEERGILLKTPHQADKRKDIYSLTEKGLDLIPILLEMANWGALHDAQTGAPPDWIAMVRQDREKIITMIRAAVQRGGSIFVGEDSVFAQLLAQSD